MCIRDRLRVIVRVIIIGDLNGQSFVQISMIFVVQCITVIFGMARYKNLFALFRHCQEYAGLLRFCQDRQILTGMNGLRWCLGVTAVRSHENIIKSPDQRNFPVGYLMCIDAEQLLGQLSLVDSVIMIESGLCRPADM